MLFNIKLTFNIVYTSRFGQDQIDEVNNGGPGILARGLYLTGAAWDSEKNILIEAERWIMENNYFISNYCNLFEQHH